eukprot:2873664-Amphidinium_carterae.1
MPKRSSDSPKEKHQKRGFPPLQPNGSVRLNALLISARIHPFVLVMPFVVSRPTLIMQVAEDDHKLSATLGRRQDFTEARCPACA